MTVGLVQRRDDDWSLLRATWLNIPLGADPARAGPTWEVFSGNFDRYLRRVSAYVQERVSDRGSLERIVTHVIVSGLGSMSRQGDDPVDLMRLEASADLLIAIEARVRSRPTPPQGGSRGQGKVRDQPEAT